MTTILCIDAGNSRIKWQVRCLGRVCAEGRSASIAPALEIPPSVLAAIDVCALSAVSSEAAVEKIQAHLKTIGLPAAAQLKSLSAWGALTNGYESPQQMGVDRWLAMVAAMAQTQGPVVVVDAGTATTVDPVGADGTHLGGYIVLGLRAMLAALGAATARINAQQLSSLPPMHVARNTGEAVLAGALESTRGLIERATQMLEKRDGRRAMVLVTGGDGSVLCAGEPSYLWRRDLVLEGIEIVARTLLVPDALRTHGSPSHP